MQIGSLGQFMPISTKQIVILSSPKNYNIQNSQKRRTQFGFIQKSRSKKYISVLRTSQVDQLSKLENQLSYQQRNNSAINVSDYKAQNKRILLNSFHNCSKLILQKNNQHHSDSYKSQLNQILRNSNQQKVINKQALIRMKIRRNNRYENYTQHSLPRLNQKRDRYQMINPEILKSSFLTNSNQGDSNISQLNIIQNLEQQLRKVQRINNFGINKKINKLNNSSNKTIQDRYSEYPNIEMAYLKVVKSKQQRWSNKRLNQSKLNIKKQLQTNCRNKIVEQLQLANQKRIKLKRDIENKLI